jgi:ATP-dependent RNA helicase RhlE
MRSGLTKEKRMNYAPSRQASSRYSSPKRRRPPARRPTPQPASAPRPLALPDALPDDGLPVEGVFATLLPELQRALKAKGYRTPTPIQEQCLPHLLAGRDLYGCAQTGTGKTAAFALPILQRLLAQPLPCRPGCPQALILAPTRELAGQIGASIAAYARYSRLEQTVIFGGVSQQGQEHALRRNIDIVVATPGRLLDLLQQRVLSLNAVRTFVLDEGDRMLDMGFLPDIRRIAGMLPKQRQSLLFSATIPAAIVTLANELVTDPVHIKITPEQPAVARINQTVLFVEKRDKIKLLTNLLRDPAKTRVIVFAQMKHAANRIAQQLDRAGIPAAAIHGNKSQGARTRAMACFKNGETRVLVATDIAARGIDVADISHVINYDLPLEAETYVHRIGRTARAGAGGDAVSFCSSEERSLLRGIESLLHNPVPTDLNHALHSEAARHATGATAGPAAKTRAKSNRRPPRSRRRATR